MYIRRELSDFFFELGYELKEMKTTNKGANVKIELQKINNSQASNESLSVRDNEESKESCYLCDGNGYYISNEFGDYEQCPCTEQDD